MLIGETLNDRHEITDLIASAGQALVARARDRRTEKTVVVKMLTATPGEPSFTRFLSRFVRESRMSVDHPGVVSPIDSGSDDGRPFIVFPCIDGENLGTVLVRRKEPFTPTESVSIIRSIAQPLTAIHASGIVHRDIKPDNILITPTGSVHIIDLGISRVTNEDTISEPGTVLGTPAWMPPEQLAGSSTVDSRADQCALGLIFYRLLTGRMAYSGQTPEEFRRAWSVPPRPPCSILRGIPKALDAACLRAIAPDPHHRFESIERFIAALALPGPEVRCLACGARVTNPIECAGCGRSFPDSTPRFEFDDGPVFVVPGGGFETGRLQIQPGDLRMSRRQLRVVCNGSVQLIDTGAVNATRVNRVTSDKTIALAPGDRIELAGYHATFRREP